ncbi:disease resistance protein RUN1-like isoform X3 [Lotus japonicus]|uniref:disease resistance protein RUN1-like isoform X3 n=1 Tax=Lotus japonicus TaxID=34305 RepID=UPI00258E19DA|nr:disease resistance protein RUN1-like isoform X3 [Lotus japonicus]
MDTKHSSERTCALLVGDTVSMDSNCSSSSGRYYKHDVFLSFKGADTRNTFVDHLYTHLTRKGIFTFQDDTSLRKGKAISPQLVQAIKDSRVSIVIFSKDYAKSTWCLDEMATIADCSKELKQTVFPVFYDVDPSHLRKQDGVCHIAFASHFRKFKDDPGKVYRWQRAMTSLASSAGWDVRNKPEFGEIEKIVQAVLRALDHKFSSFTNDLIGIQPHVKELEDLLKLSSEHDDDIRVLGIWGMGGIGKTTHATVLYDRISHQFDAPCFVENVSKLYRDGGAIAVQKQILRQTLEEKNLDTCSTCEISRIITNRLHSTVKILVVLDNVDQLEQLQELAINPKLLCAGSRIIITTRDEHILRVYGADKVHQVTLLNNNDARELFCRRAFKSEDQSSTCMELIPDVLKYAQCLPLAIRVIGSFLCTRDAIQWRDALDRLENSPHKEIMDVLQISVDGLQHEEKEMFLHIACFFKGERVDYVKRILDACGLHPHIGIQSLIEKSLITIRNQEIHMHEMLQELGKKIVRHQCPRQPGSWSRLWLYKDFYNVLETETGTDNVEGIVLDQKENVSKCKAEGLSKMKSLRLLILYHRNFSGRLTFLSNNLEYLLWHDYPFLILPSTFEPYYLVELNMPHSSIQRLWKGTKHLPCLRRVDMSNSKYLLETPSFEGIPNLERLDLTGCTNLLHVHPSIGVLTKLAFLSLRNCRSLISLDFGDGSNLCSLKVLHLSGCTKLKHTPYFTGISNLEYLDMDQCRSLYVVHESIGALVKLRLLSLRDCTNLVTIPSSVNTMTSLITLDLCGCCKLMNMPLRWISNPSFQLRSLICLNLSFCNLPNVSDAIGELRCLERLNLQGNNFVSLPPTTQRLSSLAYLNLAHCHKLECLPWLPPESASSVGKYFKTESGSRDHRNLVTFGVALTLLFPGITKQHQYGSIINLMGAQQ